MQQLRELSGGKPIGFKLCVGKKREVFAIAKAMLETQIFPDFITVDGAEGGTGAAPLEFSDSVGTPLNEGLVLVTNVLTGMSLRNQIKVIAAGKITSAFHLASKIAMGADLCNSARGMLFALGCIQALRCNNNTCPTGVTTQDPKLVVCVWTFRPRRSEWLNIINPLFTISWSYWPLRVSPLHKICDRFIFSVVLIMEKP